MTWFSGMISLNLWEIFFSGKTVYNLIPKINIYEIAWIALALNFFPSSQGAWVYHSPKEQGFYFARCHKMKLWSFCTFRRRGLILSSSRAVWCHQLHSLPFSLSLSLSQSLSLSLYFFGYLSEDNSHSPSKHFFPYFLVQVRKLGVTPHLCSSIIPHRPPSWSCNHPLSSEAATAFRSVFAPLHLPGIDYSRSFSHIIFVSVQNFLIDFFLVWFPSHPSFSWLPAGLSTMHI